MALWLPTYGPSSLWASSSWDLWPKWASLGNRTSASTLYHCCFVAKHISRPELALPSLWACMVIFLGSRDIDVSARWPISYVLQLSSALLCICALGRLHTECRAGSSAVFLPVYRVILGGLGELMRLVPSGQGQCSLRGETRACLLYCERKWCMSSYKPGMAQKSRLAGTVTLGLQLTGLRNHSFC